MQTLPPHSGECLWPPLSKGNLTRPGCQHQRSAVLLSNKLHRRQAVRTKAANPLQQLAQLFRQWFAKSKIGPQRNELMDLLSQPSSDSQRVAQLVEQLIDSAEPFQEQLLGGGPWQVVYTNGPLLWQRITGGKRSTKASQEFIPDGRRIINRGSVLGSLAEVTAEGTYALAEQEDAAMLPARIEASVASGALDAFGLSIPLPIKGSGLVDLMYLDQELRIFRSVQGSISVQRRSA